MLTGHSLCYAATLRTKERDGEGGGVQIREHAMSLKVPFSSFAYSSNIFTESLLEVALRTTLPFFSTRRVEKT